MTIYKICKYMTIINFEILRTVVRANFFLNIIFDKERNKNDRDF